MLRSVCWRLAMRGTRECTGRNAAFVLLICVLFRPLDAAGQTGCEVAAGSLVSIEGEISILRVPGRSIEAVSAGADIRLCPGESVVVGPRSRATLRLQDTGQVIRLDQNTRLRVLPQRQPGRPLLNLLRGAIELFSPSNRPLDVETPYVTAGVEGTEFYVRVDVPQKIAEVGVLAGQVGVENPQGRLSLAAGEAAVARPGLAPRRIEIHPRDQVRWAIYYPPIMWELPAGGTPIDPRVSAAWHEWQAGDVGAAVRHLNDISSTEGLNAASLDYIAAMLISLGRVDEASRLLDQSLRLDPKSPRSPALRAIVDIALNQTQRSIRSADAAVALAPTNPAARIAQSFALQSGLRLEEARAALLAARPSGNPLVLARLAEVEFYLGNVEAARSAAQQAIAAAPSLSRPRSILGFADLAQFSFAAAEETFRAAAKLDPADPLPPLGLGLTAIRLGNLTEGTKDLELAVAFDPMGSVTRSYLGKAYAADLRHHPARRQWDLAKKADPNDPSPWLYQALAERSLNRPGEALANLQRSIELNDDRAVYRSRLLLDQDLATRSADVAGIYRDLGFNQAALVQGYNSVNTDPANPSAHRFLSETFFGLPRHETASDSELLQSLLLQPLNVNPPLPRLSHQATGILHLFEPYRTGYNEFSPLFNSDGVGLLADGFGGDRGTAGGTLLASGLYRNFSMSLGQFYSRTDGIHKNGDLRSRITDLIVQPALSDRASLLAEFRYSDFNAGDFQNRFDLSNFNPIERQTNDARQYRLGGHFDAAPGVTFVGVWTRANVSALTNPGILALHEHTNADSGEAGAYLTGDRFNIVAGGSVFSGADHLRPTIFGFDLPTVIAPADDHSIWLYGNLAITPALRVTLGANYDRQHTVVDRSQFSPKLGAAWQFLPSTTLRAAWFTNLKRPLVGDPSFRSGQTIEPTQVAGFNQLYDDPLGTTARSWGVGIDHRFSHALFHSDTMLLGAEWSQRQLVVPISSNATGVPAIIEPGWKERSGRGYFNWLLSDRFAFNVGVGYEALTRTALAANLDGFTNIRLLQVPFELRYFDPSGLFGLVRTTVVREQGEFATLTSVTSTGLTSGKDTFGTVDIGLGWRYPGRPFIATIEAQNLLDSHFHFQNIDPITPGILPRRAIIARVTFRL